MGEAGKQTGGEDAFDVYQPSIGGLGREWVQVTRDDHPCAQGSFGYSSVQV